MDTAFFTPERNAHRRQTCEGIAKRMLHIQTLEAQNRDRLDFHDCHVEGIRMALETAYECGRQDEFDVWKGQASSWMESHLPLFTFIFGMFMGAMGVMSLIRFIV